MGYLVNPNNLTIWILQFWLNKDDRDVSNLEIFTFLDKKEIDAFTEKVEKNR